DRALRGVIAAPQPCGPPPTDARETRSSQGSTQQAAKTSPTQIRGGDSAQDRPQSPATGGDTRTPQPEAVEAGGAGRGPTKPTIERSAGEESPENMTSARKVDMDRDRAALGLDTLDSP